MFTVTLSAGAVFLIGFGAGIVAGIVVISVAALVVQKNADKGERTWNTHLKQ